MHVVVLEMFRRRLPAPARAKVRLVRLARKSAALPLRSAVSFRGGQFFESIESEWLYGRGSVVSAGQRSFAEIGGIAGVR